MWLSRGGSQKQPSEGQASKEGWNERASLPSAASLSPQMPDDHSAFPPTQAPVNVGLFHSTRTHNPGTSVPQAPGTGLPVQPGIASGFLTQVSLHLAADFKTLLSLPLGLSFWDC